MQGPRSRWKSVTRLTCNPEAHSLGSHDIWMLRQLRVMAFPRKRGSCICRPVKTGSPPIQRLSGICHLSWSILSSLVLPPTLRTGSAMGHDVQGHGRPAGDSCRGRVPGQDPVHVLGLSPQEPEEAWHPLLSTALHLATCPSPPSSVLPPHRPAAHFPPCPPSQSENKQEDKPSIILVVARGAGNLPSFPSFPDPDLNPRSASCQPGCSQADIAAGAFSAAFPQICLLRGLLKRSPRFLCYSRLHSLPSSKAWAPTGPRGEGAAGGQCQACRFGRKRGGWRRLHPRGFWNEGQT